MKRALSWLVVNNKKAIKSNRTDQTSNQAQPSTGETARWAARLGIPAKECRELCASGDYSLLRISIKGMTGVACENAITACLQDVAGVVKVGRVSHQGGGAYVLVDPRKTRNESLIRAVNSRGYVAEIGPARGRMTAGDKPSCRPGAKKACSKKCATPCGSDKLKHKTKVEKIEGSR